MAHGLLLRVSHAGLNSSSVFLSDIADESNAPFWRNRSGPTYVPVAGFVDLLYTTTVARSFEIGAIRKFITTGYLTAEFSFGDSFQYQLGIKQPETTRVPITVAANETLEEVIWFPIPTLIVGVKAFISEAATSAAGTYLLTFLAGATNLLNPVSFNLESLVPNTITTVPMVTAEATRTIAANTEVTLRVISNNADLVGDGLVIQLQHRAV